jgi:ferredoxin
MKNYSDELLHAELSASQQEIIGAKTRAEAAADFFEDTIIPAITGVPKPEDESAKARLPIELNEDELVARRQVRHFGQVLPIEDAERVIDLADSITRMPCGCRFISTGKTDKRYCFGFAVDKFGVLGKFPDAAASLETLSKEAAKNVFRAYDEEGLIHSIWTMGTPCVLGLCNCDHDCLAYKGYIEKGGPASFFRAEYVCQVNWELCTGCKDCMSQCQFGAQFYSSVLGKVYIDPKRCFGCGVCRAACQHDAITALTRQAYPDAANVWLKNAK